VKQASFGWRGVTFNIGNQSGIGKPYATLATPFAQSASLRRAFEEAIDRNAFVRIVYGGAAVPGCTPIAPVSLLYDSRVKCTAFNPADAKKLVAASGVAHPSLHLLTVNTSLNALTAQFIQAAEAAVGINVVIDTVDTVTDAVRSTSGQFDLETNGFTGSPAIDRNVYQFVDTKGTRNDGGYSNPTLDGILDQERRTTDVKKQRALYDQAFRIVIADRPTIVLAHPIAYGAISSAVKNVQMSPETQLRVAFAHFR
jgi:peptide/nickel transport system substrate-binding protein